MPCTGRGGKGTPPPPGKSVPWPHLHPLRPLPNAAPPSASTAPADRPPPWAGPSALAAVVAPLLLLRAFRLARGVPPAQPATGVPGLRRRPPLVSRMGVGPSVGVVPQGTVRSLMQVAKEIQGSSLAPPHQNTRFYVVFRPKTKRPGTFGCLNS